MVRIDGESLRIEDVVSVARDMERVEIDDSSLERVLKSREVVEEILKSGRVVYGINTGLGELVKVKIASDKRLELQRNLVRSHSSGVGPLIPEEVVRGAMLIRANSLVKGYSGVRPEVIESLVNFLNHGITPVVPKYGSVGASGDLAPLAHIALALMGEGKVIYRGEVVDAQFALESEGLEKLEVREREGLALLNGTAMMASYASLAVHDSYALFNHALLSAAMSFEALRGTDAALDERIMLVRNQPGQIRVARALRNLLEGSEIIQRVRGEKVQDAYTLRCIPQVYGAVLDTLEFVRSVVEREINAATDNPLIFEEPISGGNFHGEPLALALDYLGIALTDLGNMVERRIARLVDSKLSGLPDFLVEEGGLNSGLMIPQYTAAALCNRNKILAHPASVDSVPTSANQEDHVSMGMNSVQKAREIVENVGYIVAIEFLTANQALHFVQGKNSPKVSKIREALGIGKIERDVVYSNLIEDIKRKMDSRRIIERVRPEL